MYNDSLLTVVNAITTIVLIINLSYFKERSTIVIFNYKSVPTICLRFSKRTRTCHDACL